MGVGGRIPRIFNTNIYSLQCITLSSTCISLVHIILLFFPIFIYEFCNISFWINYLHMNKTLNLSRDSAAQTPDKIKNSLGSQLFPLYSLSYSSEITKLSKLCVCVFFFFYGCVYRHLSCVLMRTRDSIIC